MRLKTTTSILEQIREFHSNGFGISERRTDGARTATCTYLQVAHHVENEFPLIYFTVAIGLPLAIARVASCSRPKTVAAAASEAGWSTAARGGNPAVSEGGQLGKARREPSRNPRPDACPVRPGSDVDPHQIRRTPDEGPGRGWNSREPTPGRDDLALDTRGRAADLRDPHRGVALSASLFTRPHDWWPRPAGTTRQTQLAPGGHWRWRGRMHARPVTLVSRACWPPDLARTACVEARRTRPRRAVCVDLLTCLTGRWPLDWRMLPVMRLKC